jgi:hypothetical protein
MCCQADASCLPHTAPAAVVSGYDQYKAAVTVNRQIYTFDDIRTTDLKELLQILTIDLPDGKGRPSAYGTLEDPHNYKYMRRPHGYGEQRLGSKGGFSGHMNRSCAGA